MKNEQWKDALILSGLIEESTNLSNDFSEDLQKVNQSFDFLVYYLNSCLKKVDSFIKDNPEPENMFQRNAHEANAFKKIYETKGIIEGFLKSLYQIEGEFFVPIKKNFMAAVAAKIVKGPLGGLDLNSLARRVRPDEAN